MHKTSTGVVLTLVALLLSPDSLAERVQIPLSLDYQTIESLIREQVFTSAGDSVRLNDDGSGCQYLVLREPQVSASGGRILLRTMAEARAGRAVGGRCLLILDWHGQLEFAQEPQVGADGESVLLHTSSWRALQADGRETALSATVGQWLEQFLPVDLKQTRISFAEPLNQLEGFLAQITAPGDTATASALLDGMSVEAVAAESDRATVTLGMDVPPASPSPRSAEPELSGAELKRLEQQLDSVDAFFTYTIKAVARSPSAPDPNALLEVLMELRHDLVAILREPQRRADDAARLLFVNAWNGLAPALRAIAEQQPDHQSALRYLTFIGAGDALRALDRLGPAAGIEVSSDGLRRLARMLAPNDAGDPLQRDDGLDPELRKTLGFGDPLPPPQHYDDTSWLDWFVPRAMAAGTLDPAIVKRLNNWVPKSKDMDVYLPMVRDVLRYVVAEQMLADELDPEFHQLFGWLVFAAAWQESCWRQFVAENDMRVPMQSGSGDLGIMQINATVWRGLYDLHGLRWDIVYNVRAGADILEHYMRDYAIRHGEHRTTGSVDNLARSAYAAYNGGPRQYDRYRSADASANGRKVDALFYEKYRAVKSGEELAVTACYGQ